MSLPAEIDPNLARREAALGFLFGRIDYERVPPVAYQARQFKLERMQQLLARLENPQQQLPVVHVAGTKGKGSTSAMIGAVLSAAGYRTGVFTSPHLERLEERIAIDGQPCTSEELVWLVDRIRPVVEAMDREVGEDEIGPTYFEVTTAMALVHFARRNVHTAVLEVGLGGRLDSTNVCQPQVSLITSISFDHTRQLGNTLESIAREKAGIVKPGVPVISGVVEQRPRAVIRGICGERGSRLIELGADFDFDYRPARNLESTAVLGTIDFRYRGPAGVACGYEDLSLALPGRHQAANAAVALAALVELSSAGWNIPEQAIRNGLAGVVCPARVEVIARRPTIVVDGAHNVASIRALVEVLEESFSAGRWLLVFATTREKDIRGMLSLLAGRFDQVILTRYLSNPRAVPPEEIEAVASELFGGHLEVCASPAEAWGAVRSMAAPGDLICVTGSFFIAAEMRAECRGRGVGDFRRTPAADHPLIPPGSSFIMDS